MIKITKSLLLTIIICAILCGCSSKSNNDTVKIYSWMTDLSLSISDWKKQLGTDYIEDDISLTWSNYELIEGVQGTFTVHNIESANSERKTTWKWTTYGDDNLYDKIYKLLNIKYELNDSIKNKFGTSNDFDKEDYFKYGKTEIDGIEMNFYFKLFMNNDMICISVATSTI